MKKITEFNNYIELDLAEGADAQVILRELADKVSVRRFEIMEPSLYDIFIEVARVDSSASEADHA